MIRHPDDMRGVAPVPRLRWREYLWLLGIPVLLNTVACRWAIPAFSGLFGAPIEISYFISVGGLALAPMLFGALLLARREKGKASRPMLLRRLRIRRMSRTDWMWAVSAFLVLSLASFVIAKLLLPRIGMAATPFFMKNMPLQRDTLWILAVWPLFFFFNIFGEELFWRGYLQPRQEALHGARTWLVQGFAWACWHLPMGIPLVVASLPIFFVLPAVVYLRQNTTIALVVHAVFGAFGFLAVSLGGVH